MPSVLRETQKYSDEGLEKIDWGKGHALPPFFYKITIKENTFIKEEAKHNY